MANLKDIEVLVVGESFKPEIHGVAVREKLRAKLSLITHDSVEIAEAAHLGTAFIGNEKLSPEQLLAAARQRLSIASKPFPRRRGDDLTV